MSVADCKAMLNEVAQLVNAVRTQASLGLLEMQVVYPTKRNLTAAEIVSAAVGKDPRDVAAGSLSPSTESISSDASGLLAEHRQVQSGSGGGGPVVVHTNAHTQAPLAQPGYTSSVLAQPTAPIVYGGDEVRY